MEFLSDFKALNFQGVQFLRSTGGELVIRHAQVQRWGISMREGFRVALGAFALLPLATRGAVTRATDIHLSPLS